MENLPFKDAILPEVVSCCEKKGIFETKSSSENLAPH